jgi:hypothetical protein
MGAVLHHGHPVAPGVQRLISGRFFLKFHPETHVFRPVKCDTTVVFPVFKMRGPGFIMGQNRLDVLRQDKIIFHYLTNPWGKMQGSGFIRRVILRGLPPQGGQHPVLCPGQVVMAAGKSRVRTACRPVRRRPEQVQQMHRRFAHRGQAVPAHGAVGHKIIAALMCPALDNGFGKPGIGIEHQTPESAAFGQLPGGRSPGMPGDGILFRETGA